MSACVCVCVWLALGVYHTRITCWIYSVQNFTLFSVEIENTTTL